MNPYTPRTFSIPTIDGISKKQIDEHLKLYEGYVTHVNVIIDQLKAWQKDPQENSYLISELRRRFAFEFDGMRNHEYYFGALEGGAKPLAENTELYTALSKQFGSFDAWSEDFSRVGATRGSGWALLLFDPKTQQFINTWVDEHHLGHLSSLPSICALDCWEHAYMIDHLPSERAEYIMSYMNALNWETVNAWFMNATQSHA